jgi:hypothetical protein
MMKKEIMIAALAVGLLTGCATRDHHMAELRDLPFPVQQTILEQAPNGDIAKVQRTVHGDRVIYDVLFHEPYPELHIAADGTLMEHGRPILLRERAGAAPVVVPSTAVPVARSQTADVPVAVLNAIRAHAPNARIADIDKEIRSQVVYEVQFAEPGLNPKLHITEDGTLVSGD